jgi:hypothetical protein
MNGIKFKNYIYLDFKMFTFLCKKHFYNKSLHDYCNESTMKSIKNMIETIKNKKIFNTIFSNKYKEKFYYTPLCNLQNMISDMNPNPNNKIPYILILLSIPSIIYLYYKKQTMY